MTFTERPAARTKVHVEFDGYVERDSMQKSLQYPWQVCVNDGERIHYVNWESDIVSKAADPAPYGWPPEVGDVWEDSEGTRYLTRRNTAAPSGPAVLQTIDSDSLRVKESYPAAGTYEGEHDEDGTGFILIHRDNE